MTWEKIDEILFQGTKEEVETITCPKCGEKMNLNIYEVGFTIKCTKCGTMADYYKGFPGYMYKE